MPKQRHTKYGWVATDGTLDCNLQEVRMCLDERLRSMSLLTQVMDVEVMSTLHVQAGHNVVSA